MFDRLATPARSSSTAVYNNTATTVNVSTSNQRQFFESLFNNNNLNSRQINIHFPAGTRLCHITTMFIGNNNCQFFKNEFLFSNLTNEIRLCSMLIFIRNAAVIENV